LVPKVTISWSVSVFSNGERGNTEERCLRLDSAQGLSLTLASEEMCAPRRIRALTASEYAVPSLFSSLLVIVFQQANFYACTVGALGHISVAHPNQVDAVDRDLVVQHQVSCY
jgi:hypothetical protein